MEKVIEIFRKGWNIYVRQVAVSELDKSKCSTKFLSHNLPDNTIVNVKCYQSGEFDLRGNKGEYRIIVPDSTTALRINKEINNMEQSILDVMGIPKSLLKD